MLTRIVFSKVSRRVVFACDPNAITLWESLWPATAYVHTRVWVHPTLAHVRTSPWDFTFKSPDTIVESQELPDKETLLNFSRAQILMALARAIHRHRRSVLKLDLPGQDVIYAMKLDQASKVIAGKSANPKVEFPLIAADAELNEITMGQAANMVMMKHAQTTAYLTDSEVQRRQFTKRILESQGTDLDAVDKEITAYGNQY